jgi:glycosyltransferase involved in cell wall biosynthesis
MDQVFEKNRPVDTPFRISIVVATHNASQHLASTIDSILSQQHGLFEAIFIDAESTDRTLEIIRSYEDSRIRIQSVPTNNLFEMINRGIAMAQGEYVQILLPGDQYLSPSSLQIVAHQIADNDLPDLFYSACTIYDEWQKSHFLFRPLKKELLRQGLQPTMMQAMWVKKSTFKKLGYFDAQYAVRAAFDFFIRFAKHPELSAYSEMRVYIESKPLLMKYSFLLRSFRETFVLIRKYYGFTWSIIWLIRQKDLKRLLVRTFYKIKEAFSERCAF